jgi:hypothetical protein
VATYVNSFFETCVQQLFTLAEVVEHAFASAGLEYRVVGGLAAYLYSEEREPDAGRLTEPSQTLPPKPRTCRETFGKLIVLLCSAHEH